MTKFIHNKIQPLINFFFSICFLFSFEGNLFGQKKLNIEKLDDAVGVLIIYDNSNAVLGMGNCFCVDPNGIFYSSYKFFKNCNRAEVRLGNGETYKVNKIISSNESKDLVKFQVKKVGGQELPYLEIEKKEVKKGSDAVAIISPFNPGLMDRHSHGYIYKIYTDDITGLLRFKTNKSLPMVSSGSPLINAYGRVIGITANSRLSGTNDEYVDWAVSINEFDKLKVVNQSKFGEESGKLFNTAFYLTNKIQKNDVSLFIDEAYIGSFEYNNESNSPNCTNPGLLKTKLTEGKHSYYVIENSSGFVWDGEFTVSMNDTCLLFPLSNTPEQVTKKCYLDKYDETGISMSKPIEVENQNNSANNNNANNNANSNNSRNNSNKTNNFGTNDFRKYYRFDGGFEHRNFMAHGGWPTYAFAFEFNRSFDKTPFYASYRIS
ncbi:MAG: serine protease, partial [Bacteroidota bacterium]